MAAKLKADSVFELGEGFSPYSLALLPDSDYLVVSDADGSLRSLHLGSGELSCGAGGAALVLANK